MSTFVIPNFTPAAPEIFLLTMACVTLLVDVFASDRYRLVGYQLAQASLVGTALLVLMNFPGAEPVVTFHGAFVADRMAAVLKIFMLVISFFVFFYARVYLRTRNQLRGEFFVIGQCAVLGMLVLVSAFNFLSVFLGLELLSLSLYAMVALDRDSQIASEAAMKYFVLGALASGILLYGISLIYGATGTIELSRIGPRAALAGGSHVMLVLGLVFVLVGIAFKIGLVPFHMWIPDVYEGAPTAVTVFIGTAPKVAAFGMLMRVLVDGLGFLQHDWTQMLIVLAVLSMATGNLIAIAQTSLKRMLAYSTIAHAGYLLLGVIAGGSAGYAASMFYIMVYATMAAGAFGMIICLGRAGFEADQISDFRGLNRRNSWLAALMMVLMLSMAGVPPFLGFWAKWFVFTEVIGAGYTWLAVIGVTLAVIGLFYYLRVIRMMYFESPTDPAPLVADSGMNVMLSTNTLAIFLLGIFPSALMTVCVTALAR